MSAFDHVIEADARKTKKELIAELETLRQRLSELQRTEGSENKESTDQLAERLNRIYRDVPIGLCYFDRDLRFLLINGWLAAINGIPVDDHLGRTVGEVIPNVAAGVESQLRYVIETGEPITGGTIDAETPAHPGLIRSFQHNYLPVKSDDGTVIGVSCVVEDITERKRAEAALAEKSALLETTLESMSHGIAVHDADLRLVAFNQKYIELRGYPPGFIRLGMPDEEITRFNAERGEYGSGDVEELVREYIEIMRQGKQQRVERTRPDGTVLDIHRNRLADGRLVTTFTDITQRKRAEEALQKAHDVLESRVMERTKELRDANRKLRREIAERKTMSMALEEATEHYRQLLESTNAIPWEADAKTWMFTYVGPQAVELLGYPRELWLEKDFWVDHIHPEDRAKTIDDCQKFSAQRENYELEYRMITADGRVIWLEDIVNVMKQEGDPVTLRGFMLDITERKSLEDLQRNTSARLINAQEEERRKIARELHDDFGQRLALLAVNIQGLGQKISEPAFEGARSLDKLWSQTRKLSTDLHRLSHQLHPAILHQLGLGPAIRSHCGEISEQHGIQIKFTEHEVPASISRDIALCL